MITREQLDAFITALNEGCEGEYILENAQNNVDKSAYEQYARYYKLLARIKSENPYTPFINKLKAAFESGLSPDELRNFVSNNLNSPTFNSEDFKFAIKGIGGTKLQEMRKKEKLSTKANFQNVKKQQPANYVAW